MIGAYIVFAVLVIALLLLVAAAVLPKFRHYKWQTPLKKVEPRKRTVKRKTKKNKQAWIRIR